MIYAEAAMLHALGDTHGAIKLLSPTLDSLFLTPPQLLADGVRAASLVRAMALRAEMASVIGDPVTAQRWANAVVVLWSEADPFLKQIVSRMKKLAKI